MQDTAPCWSHCAMQYLLWVYTNLVGAVDSLHCHKLPHLHVVAFVHLQEAPLLIFRNGFGMPVSFGSTALQHDNTTPSCWQCYRLLLAKRLLLTVAHAPAPRGLIIMISLSQTCAGSTQLCHCTMLCRACLC
jgi:hypothetical protein